MPIVWILHRLCKAHPNRNKPAINIRKASSANYKLPCLNPLWFIHTRIYRYIQWNVWNKTKWSKSIFILIASYDWYVMPGYITVVTGSIFDKSVLVEGHSTCFIHRLFILVFISGNPYSKPYVKLCKCNIWMF